jgi:hypothetical protein
MKRNLCREDFPRFKHERAQLAALASHELMNYTVIIEFMNSDTLVCFRLVNLHKKSTVLKIS